MKKEGKRETTVSGENKHERPRKPQQAAGGDRFAEVHLSSMRRMGILRAPLAFSTQRVIESRSLSSACSLPAPHERLGEKAVDDIYVRGG